MNSNQEFNQPTDQSGEQAPDQASSTPQDPTSQQAPQAGNQAGTQPGTQQPVQPGSAKFFDWVRSLGISRGGNRWMGGVCSGLAQKWNIDPVIVRGLAVILTLFFGLGILVYGVAWALLPEPDGRIHAEEVIRGRWTAGTTGAAIMTLIGLAGPGQTVIWSDRDDFPFGLMWFAAVIFGAIWIVKRKKERNSNELGGSPKAGSQVPSYPAGGAQPPYAAPAGTVSLKKDGGQGPAESTIQDNASVSSNWQPRSAGYGDPRYAGTPVHAYGPAGPNGPLGHVSAKAGRQSAVKERVPSVGAAASWLIIGISIIVGAVLLLLNQTGILDLQGYQLAVAAGAAAVTTGVGILLAGIAGRTTGGLTAFAIIALVFTGASAAVPANGQWAPLTNASWSPTTITDAEAGYSSVFSNSTLDLSGISGLSTLSKDVTVPVDTAASQIRIQVPTSIPVTVKGDLAAASLKIEGENNKTTGFLADKRSVSINEKVSGHGLVIELDGAATNVTIIPMEGK